MDFSLSSEEKMFQKLCIEFAENEVAPYAEENDENETFPSYTVEQMGKYGFLGMSIPKEYGGTGLSAVQYVIANEEISKHCVTATTVMGAHGALGCGPIVMFGTEEQKKKYLPKMATGELLGAFALTEPNAGSDSASQQTTARLEGDHYILDGSKLFITNAGYAGVYIILAMTDKSAGTRGISAFIVEPGWEGFSVGKKEKKMGIRASSTCVLNFDGVKVPKENLLGKEGKGFAIAMTTLDYGRLGCSSAGVGLAQGSIDIAVKYVKERKQFGKPISAFQNTQFKLAEMQTETEAARMLTYRAAYLKDSGRPYSTAVAMAKVYTSENASKTAAKAVQLLGGYGFIREYGLERRMRDAKILEIYEGTSEIQKLVISGALLK